MRYSVFCVSAAMPGTGTADSTTSHTAMAASSLCNKELCPDICIEISLEIPGYPAIDAAFHFGRLGGNKVRQEFLVMIVEQVLADNR